MTKKPEVTSPIEVKSPTEVTSPTKVTSPTELMSPTEVTTTTQIMSPTAGGASLKEDMGQKALNAGNAGNAGNAVKETQVPSRRLDEESSDRPGHGISHGTVLRVLEEEAEIEVMSVDE